MIQGLLYVGFAVTSVDRTRRAIKELFGLPSEHKGIIFYILSSIPPRWNITTDCLNLSFSFLKSVLNSLKIFFGGSYRKSR